MQLRIDPELKSLIPPLSEDERNRLEQNIVKEGCRDPLVVWDGLLLDGHNRLEICEKHGISYETTEINFDSIEQARVWMRDNQMGRRNLSAAWRIDLQLANKEDLAKIGAAKMVEAGKDGRDKQLGGLSPSDKPPAAPKHNTQAEIAKAANTSTGMVGMAEVVRKQAPELWEKAKRDEVSVKAAYAEIKKQKKKRDREQFIQNQREELKSLPPELPPEEFDVIAIDPPWPYGRKYDPEGSRVANPYPEMSLDDIANIRIPAKTDATLFLWTTHQFLPHSFDILEKWGFDYKATLVWNKQKIGMGHWVRMQCEFCLIGIRGKPFFENTTWRDIIEEPRREHSRKPDVFYQMVSQMTAGNRVDYFSRERREGWFSYGNETEKF